MAYKVGQRVNVNNPFSTFPQDNVGVIKSVVISYIVKLDGGLAFKFDSDKVSKATTNKDYTSSKGVGKD